MHNDLINGTFEAIGGIMIWSNVFMLLKDKKVMGVNVWATVVFNLWGIWNLYYYPSLNQWASFVGGLVIVSGNTFWVFLAYKFRTRRD